MTTPRFFYHYFIILFIIKGHTAQKQTIPEHLIECYENEVIILPMTMGIFIEIIRKIEMSPYFLMDMRIFSSALIHSFCRDGIEKGSDFIIPDENVLPYTTTGFQSFKYHLLLHYLLPWSFKDDFKETLTLEEQCTLHFMLSSSIDIWERGDEYQVCSKNFLSQNSSSLINSRRKSSCPIEKGVIETKGFGTVNPSHIISGIAAALQPLQVYQNEILGDNRNYNLTYNKIVDNRWVSTFTGDLSEVLIMQKPISKENYYFGPGGKWNDTKLPIKHYFISNNEVVKNELWQFTDAEILGAIDGMRLAVEAVTWANSRRLLRLSQLLELYYTDKYTNNLNKLHACKRNLYFNEITKETDKLIEQVQSFSLIMSYYMPNYLENKSVLISESEKLVNQFYIYTSNLLRNQVRCPYEIHTKMKIKLNVIFDNTWSHHKTLAFLVNLAERVDVSYYGSTITIIARDIENIIVKNCSSIGNLFLNWKMYVQDRRYRMSLPESLTKLNELSISDSFPVAEKTQWYSHITLVLSLSTSLNDKDISDSMAMVKSVKEKNPDMIFLYVTSTQLAPMYVNFTSISNSQDDKIITFNGHDDHHILKELDSLYFNPISITPLPCINNTRNKRNIEMQEYVRPGSVNLYRIHPQYLCQVSSHESINIEFQNSDYGTLVACLSRNDIVNKDQECHKISLNDKISFVIKNPCSSKVLYGEHQTWNENCKPIYLRITAKQSLSLCTENECRTPNDVKFQININGLLCSSEKTHLCNGSKNLHLSFAHLLMTLCLAIHVIIF